MRASMMPFPRAARMSWTAPGRAGEASPERARIRREKGIRCGRPATSRRRLIGHSGKAGQVSCAA
ncbi:hypothetical protein [Streptomyces nigra]|uniref:hypothetical protein n=1 Tax=Streptomyces nigra TaxID=1827580 RepID=UPI00368C82CE